MPTPAIRKISAAETWPLRQSELRPGRPLEESKDPRDESATVFHLGAFVNHELASIASFYPELAPDFQPQGSEIALHYRLRGMATLPSYRRQRLGSSLLKAAYEILRHERAQLLWCNARVSAYDFYVFEGFTKIRDDSFEIPGIGPHFLIKKDIS